ncbi:sulfite exporter TauE/SafE family protein [Photobacterium rosenbergii]|uniref:Probable membrane transporter protein n=1 Tax=Photobacterium rosenbergii TaxID=294936 RepID=A0ABU3ZHU7_9GAMM|nr:sulfite exporter TauE/SafE family protein [Photobacterium rosenbergii]MDV5169698.1 sulfite exporter TauE/SafE family protein [Photobacterium rosenbergii]
MFESTVLFAATLIFLGSFVQTAIGFGLAIVAAPLLFQLSPHYVPAPICLVALVISLINAFKLRSSVSIGGLKSAIIGRVPGSLLGGYLLTVVSGATLSLWLGAMVLIAVAISALPYRLKPTPNRMLVAGFMSGVMGTSSSIGGPPMALLMQHEEAAKLRGNLSAFFVITSVMSLVVLSFYGHFSIEHIRITLPLLPAAILGYWMANKVVGNLSQGAVRKFALLLCLTSGLTAIYQGVSGF